MSKSALIVDDSKSARVVLKRVLESHDLDVDTAESAEDALDYLIENRPDVIFMDHLMPGMDGFEAVSAIKKNPETATIPIMMYTSQQGEVYVGQARALGAVGVLPKKVAPVEVSKVLKSLHIIGDDKQEQSDTPTPPAKEASDKIAALETLNLDLRILIHDLFEQQRAVLRRDLADSYEIIATRIADKTHTPPEVSDELPSPNKKATSGFTRAALTLLAVFTIVFGWLYWQRGQDMQEQYAELQRSFDSQRNSDLEGSLQLREQVNEYQESLATMRAANISSLEWGANQVSEYNFGDLPLNGDRLKVLEQLTDQLMVISFSGVVRIETHVADFCMTAEGVNYALAEGPAVADCDTIGFTPGEAYEIGLGQSNAFANFIKLAGERSEGRIRYEIVSLGNTDPLLAYPKTTDGVSASDWNRIAAANNRVMISLYPDNY